MPVYFTHWTNVPFSLQVNDPWRTCIYTWRSGKLYELFIGYIKFHWHELYDWSKIQIPLSSSAVAPIMFSCFYQCRRHSCVIFFTLVTLRVTVYRYLSPNIQSLYVNVFEFVLYVTRLASRYNKFQHFEGSRNNTATFTWIIFMKAEIFKYVFKIKWWNNWWYNGINKLRFVINN